MSPGDIWTNISPDDDRVKWLAVTLGAMQTITGIIAAKVARKDKDGNEIRRDMPFSVKWAALALIATGMAWVLGGGLRAQRVAGAEVVEMSNEAGTAATVIGFIICAAVISGLFDLSHPQSDMGRSAMGLLSCAIAFGCVPLLIVGLGGVLPGAS